MTMGTSSAFGTHAYGEPAYWDQRYRQDPGPFDWYQKYETLAPVLDLYLRRSHRLLVVGCGNSKLGENMIADGYQDVVNIDISSVVVEAMQKKYQDIQQLKYVKMDVRDMNSFEDGSFDAIIDKDRMEKSSEQKTWELTRPLPLNEDGSSIAAVLGKNPEVHYIYVCIKLEHIVLVHYRDVNEGSRSTIPHLSNIDSGRVHGTQGTQANSALYSSHLNSSTSTTQASYASSSSAANWNGQAPSSEDADSGEEFGGGSLTDSVSWSGFQIASLAGNDMAEENTVGCSGSLQLYTRGFVNTAGSSIDPSFVNQVPLQNFLLSEDQQKIHGASQGAGSFSGVHFSDLNSSAGWPDFLSIGGKNGNMQDQNISFGHSNCPDNMQKGMVDSESNDHRIASYVTDGGCNVIANALTQIFTEVGKRNDQGLSFYHSLKFIDSRAMLAVTMNHWKTYQTQVKEENTENTNNFDDEDVVKESTHLYQVPHDDLSHVAVEFKNNSGSRWNVSVPDQPLEYETEVSNTSNKPSKSDAHNDEHGDLKKLDSFGRWMNKEIGKDCNDSLMASDSGNYWNALDTQNDDKEVSSLPRHMQLDIDSLGPSLSQEQLFSIVDFSPDWAYSGVETKVLISGTFMGSVEPTNIKWCCMFGELEVPAEVLTTNILHCRAPAHVPGRVPFYITRSDRLACSEIREFEYRENLSGVSLVPKSEPEDEIYLQVRFAKLLSLGVDWSKLFCSVENCSKCSLKQKLFLMLNEEENGWEKIEKDSKAFRGFGKNPRDALIQKLLKGKLYEWLVCKAHVEGRGPNILDEEGQGAIHLAAALGYDWAMAPIVTAGVSPSFRDAHGRTGLHWAAYHGREETVVTLIRLGAAPGAVEDPTSKFPHGQTAADLASNRGHKGIAGYLAEADLTSHLSSLALNESVTDSVSATLGAQKAIETVQDQNVDVLNGDDGEQLSLRGSLAAVMNSAQAAARIQAAFRLHSFRQRQLRESKDEEAESFDDMMALSALNNKFHRISHFNEALHAAAIKIQQKYRGWKGRKEFLKIRDRIVKIQAHVRGHQVRKQYKKVVWSVSIVEKAILRWRRRGAGLRGFRAESASSDVEQVVGKIDEYDFLRLGRKQKAAGVEKALARVRSMARNPEARDQYMRLVACSRKSKVILYLHLQS
ncbi:calmodulin-binding transcription activator 1 [Cocos nucifera]|uniref:Calmodulin-binding transcription activator 1 n=1 Tax=Cocos nucifera TaxID=13894 RepID=A0A8K0NE75_COCNU|nr:calmodulin-binding transcription activator 1 [Cocos nucifera]